jgi:hypothetical protein
VGRKGLKRDCKKLFFQNCAQRVLIIEPVEKLCSNSKRVLSNDSLDFLFIFLPQKTELRRKKLKADKNWISKSFGQLAIQIINDTLRGVGRQCDKFLTF